MTKRMLIDATHSEETRVVVADNQKLLDYEYESAMRKQLRGNIFLAKVTRVEPSLQAAFVNYGGNRHGFLPFSEIHPDYYRIPIADREALLEEQRQALEEARRAEEEEDAELEEIEKGKQKKGKKSRKEEDPENIETLDDDTKDEEPEELGGGTEAEFDEDDADAEEDSSEEDADNDESDEGEEEEASEDAEDEENSDSKKGKGRRFSRNKRGRYRNKRNRRASHRSDRVEMVGGDSIDGDRPIRPNLTRRYKIQEVIKRGQIMLIQVSKEERGAKGAAVTSYLSLPGRYCVLMPNSPRSGGVSRKIANYKDRKRLREILKEFNVPEGMSVIVRTAGVARTKTEIKRDLDYLLRLWDNIRSTTLESQAPALIYEEGNLVKRAIRDIYDRDMQEVIVEGDNGYKIAKDVMKMMIPSHAKRVKEYKDRKRSLYQAHGLEDQISGIGEPSVPLKSGGSLVIHPTEALVSIDVNSGRATKERHIEETALRTNLEAAEEVARQLRLRDLGGLVVIDFIDMEDRRNNGKVERKLKEALSTDRARLQVGRISSFGLLELSRQRISASVTETQFQRCAHCEGTGFTRTVDSMAILVLRALETMAIEGQAAQVAVTVTAEVALYILNQKRHKLTDIEERYDMKIFIHAEDNAPPAFHEVEVLKTRKELAKEERAKQDDQNDEDQLSEAEEESDDSSKQQSNNKNRGGKNNRNQRGRGRGRKKNQDTGNEDQNDQKPQAEAPDQQDSQEDEQPKKRGRKPKNAKKDEVKEGNSAGDKPKKQSRGKKKSEDKADDKEVEKPEEDNSKSKKSTGRSKKKEENVIEQSPPSNDDKPAASEEADQQEHARAAETVNEAPATKKKGWWNRIKE